MGQIRYIIAQGLVHKKWNIFLSVYIPIIYDPGDFQESVWNNILNSFEHTCAYARQALMHCFASVCLWVTGPKFRLDKNYILKG